MKRLFILLIALITVLSLLALPIAADEASDADAPKQTTSVSNENDNNGNKDEDKNATLTDIFNSISDIAKYFKEPERILELIEIDISGFEKGTFFVTLLNGGYNYFSGEENPINLMISTLYNITYPIGIVVMVIVWIIGLIKGTTTMALDLKDKNSLAHSMVGFLIGLAAMTVAPYILTALTAISNWLCVSISSISIKTWIIEIFDNKLEKIFKDIKTVDEYKVNLYFLKNALGVQGLYGIIVIVVIEFVFCLNMLWLALLQVVSPIFIGLCASGIARKFTFNFIKEYFKALLMPVLSLIYIALSTAMLATDNLYYVGLLSLLLSLVLAISTLGIAGKKLDKLIN